LESFFVKWNVNFITDSLPEEGNSEVKEIGRQNGEGRRMALSYRHGIR